MYHQSEGPLRIVCLGDSITGPASGARYQGQYLKYADLLQLMVDARLGEGAAKVLNRGHAGQTTQDALGRFEAEVLKARPKLVTVLLGGNDAREAEGLTEGEARAKARTRTIEALWSMVESLNVFGARVLVLLYHCLPNPDDPAGAWTGLTRYNDAIAGLAYELRHPVLDMNEAMHRALGEFSVVELVNERDGVHLNPAGEMVYARAIFNKWLELGWLPEPTTGPLEVKIRP